MAKLSEKERAAFEGIIGEDMMMINARFMSQLKDFWAKAREEVLKTKGWDALIIEKDNLQQQIQKCNVRIHEIEGLMQKKELPVEKIVELGGTPNDYGRFKGANFHGIPVESEFDYEIVEYIRTHIDINIPAKFIFDLGRATQRALAMSGTFEEARSTYEEFYALDFRSYGVDIPPRLVEVKQEVEKLAYAQSTLALPVDKQGDRKAIEHKRDDMKAINYVG